jgi:uncharacterized protein YcbX
MRIASIHRYPVKSLAGERLGALALAPGRGLLDDRRYAFVPAPPGAVPPVPGWRPKTSCVALVRYTGPARLAARYDDASGMLALSAAGIEIACGRPENEADRARLEAAAARELDAEVGGGVALVGAGKDTMLTDVNAPFVSLVNLASVGALAAAIGVPLDPLRFRANFYFEGAPAWAERGWVGKELRLGTARFEIAQPIRRCAAIEVDPATATRRAALLRELADGFGHVEMGVYARVFTGGTAAPGEALGIG